MDNFRYKRNQSVLLHSQDFNGGKLQISGGPQKSQHEEGCEG